METMNYQEQAQKFLDKAGATFSAVFVDHAKYFDDDTDKRDIYLITLKRNGGRYSFRFGQSIAGRGTEPTPYDVLAAITKNDPGDIDDFAAEYGYSDVKPSHLIKTYKAVVREWKNVSKMFGDIMDELQEIA